MEKTPGIKISIVIVAYNEEDYISRCLNAVLSQTHPLFELIVVNYGSKDNTEKIVGSFKDSRVKYIKNKKRSGIAASRNTGIMNATADYIFFTDADCLPTKNWISEGIKTLVSGDCCGVEGKTCYETAVTSLTDRIIENISGGRFLTCNIGYKRSALENAGFFNEEYKLVSEDTDLGLKIKKNGKILFSQDMLVFHQIRKQTISKYFQHAFKVFSKVKYIKNSRDFNSCFFRIMYPSHLAMLLFPPLLVIRNRIVNLKEFLILPFIYLSYIFERALIWIAAIKEKVFVV